MGFKILKVAIITRSPLRTTGQLVPLRKWTFAKRLRKFEIQIHVLSGFGRSFLPIEIARRLVLTKVTEINENLWFLKVLVKPMDLKTLNVASITRSQLQIVTSRLCSCFIIQLIVLGGQTGRNKFGVARQTE